jgi:hypothetical protein
MKACTMVPSFPHTLDTTHFGGGKKLLLRSPPAHFSTLSCQTRYPDWKSFRHAVRWSLSCAIRPWRVNSWLGSFKCELTAGPSITVNFFLFYLCILIVQRGFIVMFPHMRKMFLDLIHFFYYSFPSPSVPFLKHFLTVCITSCSYKGRKYFNHIHSHTFSSHPPPSCWLPP